MWSGCLLEVSLGRRPRSAHPGGDPGSDQGHTGQITSPGLCGVTWCPPRGVAGGGRGEESQDLPLSDCSPLNPDPDKLQKTRRDSHTAQRLVFEDITKAKQSWLDGDDDDNDDGSDM